jgi:hypothetical protein
MSQPPMINSANYMPLVTINNCKKSEFRLIKTGKYYSPTGRILQCKEIVKLKTFIGRGTKFCAPAILGNRFLSIPIGNFLCGK